VKKNTEIFQVDKIVEEKKRKILFMDDQASIRKMMVTMLAHLGYEVEFAQNGSETIKMYKIAKEKGQPFDAVILDLTVPGEMGGEYTMQKLLDIDPEVIAIITSGYSNKPIMSEYKKYGFSGAITKPYTMDKLAETLSGVISGDRKEAYK